MVLARHKDTKRLAALKVVYLQSPEMDDEHLAVTRKCALFRPTLCRITVCGLHLKHVGLAVELHEHPGRGFRHWLQVRACVLNVWWDHLCAQGGRVPADAGQPAHCGLQRCRR